MPLQMNDPPQGAYGGRRTVFPSGDESAPVYVVTACPEMADTISGINLSGSEGEFLLRQLERVGIRREDCRLSSCVWLMPPSKRNLSSVSNLGVTRQVFTDALIKDITAFPRRVIIAVGDEALTLLTGKTKITKWRGSILTLAQDAHTFVVPTLDVGFIQKGNWPLLLALRSDCQKASRVLRNGFIHPKREFMSYSRGARFGDFKHELERLSTSHGFLAYDIEGWYPRLSCISFSDCPSRALSVPLNGVFDSEKEDILFRLVRETLENPHSGKVAHNMLFDNLVLRFYGIGIKNIFMDTMLAHHSVLQDLPHSLAFVTSVYTDEEYYKDDRTMIDFVGSQVDADDYSCMDSAVTLEIVKPLIKELIKYDSGDFFFNVIMPRVKSASNMQVKGMPIHEKNRKKLRTDTQKKLLTLESSLMEQFNLNPHSPKQTCNFLYSTLGLKKQFRIRKTKKGKEKTISSDDDAIRTCIKNAPQVQRPLMDILECRVARKALSTYINSESKDGKFFYSVNIGPRPTKNGYKGGTPSGRYSIGKCIDNTGIPAQGIPKKLRLMIGNEDKNLVIWECDSSQAEARVVAWRAGEDFLVDAFNAGVDVHKQTGVLMHPLLFGFKLDYEEVIGDLRQFYKKIRHALNYWMGPRQLQQQVNTDMPGFKFDYKLARAAITAYHEVNHETYQWGLDIEQSINSGNRILRSCHGRIRHLLGQFNDDLVRSAISFEPQATVADMVILAKGAVQKELIELDFDPKRNYVFNQVHDSIVGVCERKNIPATRELAKRLMEQELPLEYKGQALIIPSDFSIGQTWGEMEEI